MNKTLEVIKHYLSIKDELNKGRMVAIAKEVKSHMEISGADKKSRAEDMASKIISDHDSYYSKYHPNESLNMKAFQVDIDQSLYFAGIDKNKLSPESIRALKMARLIYDNIRVEDLFPESLKNAKPDIEKEFMYAKSNGFERVDISDSILKAIAFGDGITSHSTGFEPHSENKHQDFKALCLEVEISCMVAGGMSINQIEDEIKYKREKGVTIQNNEYLKNTTKEYSGVIGKTAIKVYETFEPLSMIWRPLAEKLVIRSLTYIGEKVADRKYNAENVEREKSPPKFHHDDPYDNGLNM